MKKISRILLIPVSLFIILTITATTYGLHVTKNTKFDETKLFTLNKTTFFDCSNEAMIDTSTKITSAIPLNELPQYVKNAFISIEDKRFYKHNGIDYKRIIGATINNLKSASYKEGASTISQQLIKNTHLTTEKTVKRKLKEIKLTRQLEKRYTKNEILEIYLNTIYFGENAYGIDNASKRFFNKSASELTLPESAVLAGLIKAPATYSPYRHPQKAIERRNTVLKLMNEQGFISTKEYKIAINTPLTLNYKQFYETNATYLNCVKEELDEVLNKVKYSKTAPLNVYTYYNPKITQAVTEEIENHSKNNNYCGIICDNQTHGVVTLSSDVGLIKRNPASTVKPWLVYAPAIEEKQLTMATKILDEKTNFNGYTPSAYNDKYYGYVSVKECIARSLNVPAVKTANMLGTKKLQEYSNKMGLLLEGGLGIALGDIKGGMTAKEICDYYTPLVCNGNFSKYRFIKKITTKNGKTIYENETKEKRVFSEETAYLISDALNECVRNGTAKKLNNHPYLCAKTGTNGNKKGNIDAYAVAYTPEYLSCIWLGNADNTLMPNSVSGGTYPAIILNEIWNELIKQKKPSTPKMPHGITKITIDDEVYEKDCEIRLGEGKEFLFITGTEPKSKTETKREIFNVKQNCENGLYLLTYTLLGYDGVDVFINDKLENNTNNIYPFTKKLTEGQEYTFTLSPYYYNEIGEKIKGEQLKLPTIKYKKQSSSHSTIIDWWSDD